MIVYYLFCLLTGIAKKPQSSNGKTSILNLKPLTILDTKNHEAHVLPLASFVFDLLENRKQYSVNDYVFPGTHAEGYIIEPRKQMGQQALNLRCIIVKDVTSGYIIANVERLRKPIQAIADFIIERMQGKLK